VNEVTFHRLLVAIDGSASAELALAAAVTAARRDGAALTLIGVAPDVVAEATRWPNPLATPCPPQDEVDAEIERHLREAVAKVPSEIPVTTVVRRGKPGPQIVAESRSGRYDAILLGARGLGRIGALIGSVSQHVLRHADIAVFVAHAPRGDGAASA
jgi:nucleotide-binding universal stress UspA family protein